MGMTVIAMANSFIDLFIDAILSKQGHGLMAITGIFAGQMFNFLLGFSISGILRFLVGDRGTFNLYSPSTIFRKMKESMVALLLVASLGLLVYYIVALKMKE